MNHQVLLAIISAVWVGSEVMLGIISRRGDSATHDRGSLRVLWALLVVAIFVAARLRAIPLGRMPQRNAMFWIGIALIVIGIIVRASAIFTLRRFFTVAVTIQDSHELIDRGLYNIVRHPSYSGALVSFIGLGFAFGNWMSLAVILAGALIGFAYRIRVEEAALTNHFGDRYRAYAARTKRLIPGIY